MTCGVGLNVLVTGIGGGGNGEQILKTLRLSKLPNLNIVGTDITEYTMGRKYVDVFYKIRPASDLRYGEELFNIIEKHAVNFLFTGSDPELAYLSEHRAAFRQKSVGYYLNSEEMIMLCRDKFKTYQKMESLGYKVPRYHKIERVEDIYEIDFYPALLKPSTNSGGSSNVFIVADQEDALLLGRYMLKGGLDIVAQQYVGSHEEEYTIGVNSDERGNVLGSIVLKRIIGNAISSRHKIISNNRPYVVSSGFSQGIICHMPELQEQAEEIAKALYSTGPLNIQCRVVEGRLRLMEINPRISGSASLRAMCGYNEPEMIINYYLHGKEWSREYKDKVILRGLEEFEIDA